MAGFDDPGIRNPQFADNDNKSLSLSYDMPQPSYHYHFTNQDRKFAVAVSTLLTKTKTMPQSTSKLPETLGFLGALWHGKWKTLRICATSNAAEDFPCFITRPKSALNFVIEFGKVDKAKPISNVRVLKLFS